MTALQEVSGAAEGGGMGMSSVGVGNVGRGLQGDWVLCHKEAEYNLTIYCNVTNYEPLWKVFSEAGSKGVLEVVVAGSSEPIGVEGENAGRFRRRGLVMQG